jgi:hypothetical protein
LHVDEVEEDASNCSKILSNTAVKRIPLKKKKVVKAEPKIPA